MTHAEYKAGLALDALDALDAPEQRALAAHVATCADCRAELEELRAVAAALVYAAPPVAPTPELRTRLLAQLKTTPQTSNTNGTAHAAQANVLPFAPPARRRGRPDARALFGAVAAVITIAVLAGALALLWARTSDLQTELARTNARLQETQQTLAAVRADRDLLAAVEVQTTELAGTDAATQARARLTYDPHTGRALLVTAGLPAAPAGKAYQLWFIAGGQPLPGGVFSTDASGRAEFHEQIPPAGRAAQVFAITLEPQTGVSAPTGPIVLKGAVS